MNLRTCIGLCCILNLLLFTVAKFVSALAADGAIDETTLSTTELQTIYGPFTQRINESLAKQEQVMGQVQVRITPSFAPILYVHGLDPLCIATMCPVAAYSQL